MPNKKADNKKYRWVQTAAYGGGQNFFWPHRENCVNHTIFLMQSDIFCQPPYYAVWNHPQLFGSFVQTKLRLCSVDLIFKSPPGHLFMTSRSVLIMIIPSNRHIYHLNTFVKMLKKKKNPARQLKFGVNRRITKKKTHTNRRQDQVMVTWVSQNALKQSQGPLYGARFNKGSSHLFLCML